MQSKCGKKRTSENDISGVFLGVNLEQENDIYSREWGPEIFAPGVWDRSGACLSFDEKDVPAWSSPGFGAASALVATYSAPTHVEGGGRGLSVNFISSGQHTLKRRLDLWAMLPVASISLSLNTLFFVVRKLFSALSYEAVSFTKAGI